MQARICYDCATRLAITTTAPCKDCQPRHATSAPFIPDSVSQITAARVSDINEIKLSVLKKYVLFRASSCKCARLEVQVPGLVRKEPSMVEAPCLDAAQVSITACGSPCQKYLNRASAQGYFRFAPISKNLQKLASRYMVA